LQSALKPSTAACPLRSLTAVIFDTETTSLDVKRARIVEIGAVALINGRLEESTTFSTLVDPGEPIPAEAVAVHGISDAMVRGQPGFAEACRQYQQFAGRHAVLGYSLGFDFAVLKSEHQRDGLAWTMPRALDVADLVAMLEPELPDLSLEKVASWLGIAAENRHRAVADALLTGKVFLALLPRLRERGVRTLAEAAEACRKRAAASSPASVQAVQSTGALARVDSYPYRHRVRDVMASPAITISRDAALGQALHELIARKISSLFVEPTASNQPYGIITERDILRAIAANRSGALDASVASAASFPLETVMADDFIYSAFGRMRRKRYRHLGVTDETGKLTGALTQRDLLRQRADDAIALTDAMDEAAGVNELAIVWRKLADAARSLFIEEVDPRDIAAIISNEVCNLTARAAAIAEREMEQVQAKPDGLAYAVMVLGSGGRGESLLAMDQDNAVIFEDGEEGGSQDAWLKAVATRMNAILDEVGVPLCKGGVMARNEAWRKSARGWRKQVASWLSRSDPQDILNADIFFDALPVFGEARLAEELRRDAVQAAQQATAFLKLMAISAATAEAPVGWFGRWRLEEDGRMDLKRGGILPIYSAARVVALQHGVLVRSTAARLEALRDKENVPAPQIEHLLEAHRIILGAILHQQLADIERGIPPSNRVDPKDISTGEKERLKWTLEQVKSVRDLVGDPVG
jgi:DNA polymerase-3 subunit epsilon/CBS domain-containing protein